MDLLTFAISLGLSYYHYYGANFLPIRTDVSFQWDAALNNKVVIEGDPRINLKARFNAKGSEQKQNERLEFVSLHEMNETDLDLAIVTFAQWLEWYALIF